MSLKISDDAARQIAAATAWWAANRPEAPGLVAAELEEALARISAHPYLGMQVRVARLSGVRRRLLPPIRYHIYYRVDGDDIEIMAFWHASRRSGPPL